MKELAEWTMQVLNIDPESENWIYDILLLVMIVFIATVCGIIMRRLILPLVKKLVRKTHVKWDDYIFSDGVIKVIGQLVPAIIAYFLTSLLFCIPLEESPTTSSNSAIKPSLQVKRAFAPERTFFIMVSKASKGIEAHPVMEGTI